MAVGAFYLGSTVPHLSRRGRRRSRIAGVHPQGRAGGPAALEVFWGHSAFRTRLPVRRYQLGGGRPKAGLRMHMMKPPHTTTRRTTALTTAMMIEPGDGTHGPDVGRAFRRRGACLLGPGSPDLFSDLVPRTTFPRRGARAWTWRGTPGAVVRLLDGPGRFHFGFVTHASACLRQAVRSAYWRCTCCIAAGEVRRIALLGSGRFFRRF